MTETEQQMLALTLADINLGLHALVGMLDHKGIISKDEYTAAINAFPDEDITNLADSYKRIFATLGKKAR